MGALGSDTGGSIRNPAALFGLAGLKPTYGLVSRFGVYPNSFSYDHAGPMTWSVEDCAIILQTIARHDPKDPASADRPVPDYRAALTGGIKGLRIGMLRVEGMACNAADARDRRKRGAAASARRNLRRQRPDRRRQFLALPAWARGLKAAQPTDRWWQSQPLNAQRATEKNLAVREFMDCDWLLDASTPACLVEQFTWE